MNEDRVIPFWLIALGTILVLGLLTVIFWDFVSQNVILPIYSFFILAVYGINSVQQSIYLFLLILIATAGSVVFLGSAFSQDKPPQYGSFAQYAIDIDNPYAYWKMHTGNLTRNVFSNEEFARVSRKLLLEMLAYQEHRDPIETEMMILRQELELPPEVQYVIEHRKLRASAQEANWFQRQWRRILRWINRDNHTPTTEALQEVEAIITFLEQRLEIYHNE